MAIPIRVLNHPIVASLRSARELLERIPPEFDQQQPDLMARTRASVDLLAERLDNPAVAAISDGALNNGQSWLQVIVSELQAAIDQNNANLLQSSGQLLPNVDAISQNLGQFPFSQPADSMNLLLEEAQRRLTAMQGAQMQQEELWRSIKDDQARILDEVTTAKQEGLKRLQEQEVAAGKLLAALGAEATSNGYRLTAEHERTEANFWRWVTIIGGVVSAVFAVLVFWLVPSHGTGTAAAIVKFGITLPLVLLTIYAGNQSAGHRHQERDAKQLELAFGSVDAYLADLDADRRAEVKATLTSNLFRTAGVNPGPPGDYPSSSDIVGLLRDAIKKLR
jgi:hypothetical protein